MSSRQAIVTMPNNFINMNSTFNYEQRIVAFIDILGFENIIKSTTKSQGELDNLGNALNYIHQYFISVQSNYPDPSTIQLSQFSDSIVISISMKNSNEALAIFKHLKTIQINLLNRKILLRGGIIKGQLIHTDKILLGPGMINAYKLESKCALHPRIVIDPKVLWQFSRVDGVKQILRLKDFDYEKSFSSEPDGTAFIDYFNDVKDYLPDNCKAHTYFENICSLIAKYIDNEDISIRVKYLWMREKVKTCEYYDKYKTIYRRIVINRNKNKKNPSD